MIAVRQEEKKRHENEDITVQRKGSSETHDSNRTYCVLWCVCGGAGLLPTLSMNTK